MILYNGSGGSLGRYFLPAATALGHAALATTARLEDRDGVTREFKNTMAGQPPGSTCTLVQMAALVSVPACERDPALAAKTNITDTVATVDDFVKNALSRGLAPRIVYVSTGHVYGAAPDGVLLPVDAPLAPRSVYAQTKLSAEGALSTLTRTARVPLVVARVFGLIAPKQPAHYVLPALIRRIRKHDLGDVPGLSCVRDYLDARDVCRVLVRLCELLSSAAPEMQVFNVCSGSGITIRDLAHAILREIEPASWRESAARLTEAPARPDDIQSIIGDPGRIVRLIGFNPRQVPLEQTIHDAIESV